MKSSLRSGEGASKGTTQVDVPTPQNASHEVGSCKDCRWWSPVAHRPGVGECGGIDTQWEWRYVHELHRPDEEELAVMLDRNAQLFTRESFGCRCFEP